MLKICMLRIERKNVFFFQRRERAEKALSRAKGKKIGKNCKAKQARQKESCDDEDEEKRGIRRLVGTKNELYSFRDQINSRGPLTCNTMINRPVS